MLGERGTVLGDLGGGRESERDSGRGALGSRGKGGVGGVQVTNEKGSDVGVDGG